MNKILLASTALVLSAGLAHAQAVTITGEGRMGIQYDDWGVAGGGFTAADSWRQENRLTLNFNVSVEADHGLTFGAWSRARMQSGGLGVANQGVFSGSRVWVESNGLKLTFGNQDGAIRGAGTAMGYAGGCAVGYEGGQICADTAGVLNVSQGQNSTGSDDVPMARIDYTMGSTRVALSHGRNAATEFGIRSTFDAFTVALGYSNGNGTNGTYGLPPIAGGSLAAALDDVTTISGSYNGGSWTAAVIVARINVDSVSFVPTGLAPVAIAGPMSWTNWALQGSVQLGGGTMYGYVGDYFDGTAYGLNYAYSLGGGATVTVGAERATDLFGSGIDHTTGSVGVAFVF
ncbi:porin [Pararhodobacter zhoushanensis]|uniref:porin n=1 Tax=Pararhodobacter zhoushanensis TaxID=2479545 RepID=UPI000F8E2F84|nr:porin [Pararhodobacter zhoushanensis]